LQAGYSPDVLVEVAIVFDGWIGSVSQVWNGLVERFEWLKQQPEQSMHGVGEIGSKLATEKRDRARALEKEAAIHGYD